MTVNGNQTLIAIGGMGPYTWSRTSGGGSLSGSSGTSVTYTAPSSNANCDQNPTIQLGDNCGNKASLQLAINQYTAGESAYVYVVWGEFASGAPCTQGGLCFAMTYQYTRCNGSVNPWIGAQYCSSPCSPIHCVQCLPDCEMSCKTESCCWNPGPCGGDCQEKLLDLRTDTMKAQGCCPAIPSTCLNITSFRASATKINLSSGQTANLSGEIFSNSEGGTANWALMVAGREFTGTGNSVTVSWDGKDGAGKEVAPGTYNATLVAKIDGGSCDDSDARSIPITITATKPQCLDVEIGSSVNVANGNLNHSQVLFSLSNSRFIRDFSLFYNSLDGGGIPLGTGWTHVFNIRIKPNKDGSYTLFEGDGTKVVLYNKGDRYTPEKSNYPALTVNGDGTSSLEKKASIFYQFDGNGRITRILDRNSNAILFTYDFQNNLVLITDPSGRNVSLAYNEDNRIQTVIDPMGNSHSFSYSGQHLSEVVSNILGKGVQKWVYTYDENGFMLSKTDPLGYVTAYAYDADHRLSRATDPEGRSRIISYDPSNSTSLLTKKDGGIWTYRYDPRMGVLTARIDPAGGTEAYTYDENRNMVTATDENGHVTRYEHDANANVTLIQDPLGGITFYTYSELNKVTSRTDPLGNVTRFAYDGRGNLISITDPAGGVSNISYDSKGNIVEITNPLGLERHLAYDQNSYLTSVADASGAVTNFSYDSVGNLIKAIDPMGNVNRFQYSSLNRLLNITDPLGNVTTNAYDLLGNRTSLKDANGNTTFYAYNYRGQITELKDALGNVTRAAYGGVGCPSCGKGVDRLTSLTDANGNATGYQYDTSGRLIRETDPLGNTATYSYDAAGNLVAKTDANGHTILYAYDALNRLIEKTYPDGTKEVFGYDANGNILVASNKDISYNFLYESNGGLINVIDSNGRIIQYQYDSLGNRVQMTPPEGGPIDYRYDANNRLSEIIADGGSYRFAYDALGRRVQLILSNGTYVDYIHDPGSRLTNLSHKTSGESLIDQFAYTHDGVGNRLTKTDTEVQTSYFYDAIYQLTQVLPSGLQGENPLIGQKAERFSYDPVGNRLTGPKKMDFYSYDKANQLTGDRRFGYENDQNGNLIKKTLIDTDGGIKIFSYQYDYENRLIMVEIRKADRVKTVTFAYDPFGRRISKTILREDLLEDEEDQGEDLAEENELPRITQFVYDHEDIILEYNRRGKVKTRYIHGPGVDEPLAVVKKGVMYYYHADGLGSITALTDEQGTVVQQYEYDSFGRITKSGIFLRQPYTFTGREWDQETGLYYYRARHYDPKTGRFLSRDPIGFAGGDMNLPRYVLNNPVIYRDPWGLWGEDVHSGIGNPNYGTYTWARQVALSSQQATWIALGNNGTDAGFAGWMPIFGLQSRHFNQWPLGRKGDSRDYWAEIELRRAVDYYKKGNCKAAFGHLGKGLHSVQDIIAHRDFDTGWHGIYRHPEWYDLWRDPRNESARELTERATKNYLIRFLNLTGLR
jgi:RHS repeat-associated protein